METNWVSKWTHNGKALIEVLLQSTPFSFNGVMKVISKEGNQYKTQQGHQPSRRTLVNVVCVVAFLVRPFP